MRGVMKTISILVLLSLILMMVATTVTVAKNTRLSGTYQVPQWSTGEKWGYKMDSYGYYYGVGFEVEGTENINGNDCYKIKIWWDSNYGEDSEFDGMNYDVPGLSSSYLFVGNAWLTKDKLAIAKFTLNLEMIMKFDGSKIMDFSRSTRQSDSYDSTDYAQLYENMMNWKYDMSYKFEVTTEYNPPFVMYDYPLENGESWTSSSEVTISWSYEANIDMNDDMKKDIEKFSEEISELDYENQKDSDTENYALYGEFEVIDQSTVTTDMGTHDIFEIEYDITTSYTRGTRSYGSTGYGEIAIPGGDNTLALIGGAEGEGTSYYDPVKGYPQKMETTDYYYNEEIGSTVEPTSIIDTHNKLADKSTFDKKDEDDNSLMLILAVVAVIVIIVVVLIVVLVTKWKKQQKRTPPPPPGHPGPGEPYPPQQGQGQQPPPRDDYYRDDRDSRPPPPRDDYRDDRGSQPPPRDDYYRQDDRGQQQRPPPRDDYYRDDRSQRPPPPRDDYRRDEYQKY